MGFHIPNVLCLEDAVWIAVERTGVRAYDFDFESFFSTRHLFRPQGTIQAIARMGAADDYG